MSQKPTVLISGASRGLGAETAKAAAQLGANLILTARSEKGLKTTEGHIKEAGHDGRVTLISGDLSDNEFCRTLAARVTEVGPLHAAVLNAARIDPIGAVDDIDEEEWLRCLHLNLSAPFLLAKKLLPALTQTRGRLITVGTGAATQPIPSWSAYCASKAALLMLIRVIATEKPDITAFSFAPGATVPSIRSQNGSHSGQAAVLVRMSHTVSAGAAMVVSALNSIMVRVPVRSFGRVSCLLLLR